MQKGAIQLNNGPRTIVKMLSDHELALKELYLTYAAKIPSLKDFWLGLAEDEQRHSDWLQSLISAAGTDDSQDLGCWPRFAAVESSLKYIRAQTVRAKQGEIPLLVALAIAKDLESALLEKEFFRVADSTSSEVRAVLGKLVAGTETHGRAVAKALDAAKCAAPDPQRA
ncbi:MAG: hypothetical protein MUC88_23050 [Planctomycetes bacterium]|jgi:hypothetical protein|nr:hypothetical protein [Planctomycetota bacterium]